MAAWADVIVSAVMDFLKAHPYLAVYAVALASIVSLAQILAPLTPSPKDDAALAKVLSIPVLGKLLLKLVEVFAPFQKK